MSLLSPSHLDELDCDTIEALGTDFPDFQTHQSTLIATKSVSVPRELDISQSKLQSTPVLLPRDSMQYQNEMPDDKHMECLLSDILQQSENWKTIKNSTLEDCKRYDPVKRLHGSRHPPKYYIKASGVKELPDFRLIRMNFTC